ncbi:VOC family protein [Fictibacillus sp. NRS-1165]|uniref:VOC family protein n=1 Tax=Fictibacillus sp. NRS-1165 TaxID=3144463 RepID=UPI003D1D4ADB
MKVHHYGISVRDMDAASEFYKKALGMKERFRFHWMGEHLLFLDNGSIKIELVERIDGTDEASHIAYVTHHLEGLADSLRERGVLPLEGPYQLENGWRTVFYEGRSGEVIEFVEE